LDLITFFYPNIEIEQDKYINKIQCSLWYKQMDIQMAMDSLKQSLKSKYTNVIDTYILNETDISLLQNTMVHTNETNNSIKEYNISIYDAYIYYCKFIIMYDPMNQIINKSYFDKYINENYSKYIIDNCFLSIKWTTK
jgi:hypothetical protein